MKNSPLGVAFVVLLVAFVALLYFRQQEPESTVPAETASREEPAAAPAEPAVRYPLPPADTAASGGEKALPALKESDPTVEAAARRLLGEESLYRLLLSDQLIRRIVVTVDNLPRRTLPTQYMPLKKAEGTFQVRQEGDAFLIDPQNYGRYEPFVRLADRLDPEQVVSAYVRFYPLFQEAYRELGYPQGYFNDRLIEVIDHLLDAPEMTEAPRLVQPVTSYKFADPALEELSAGRKILIRIGPENAGRIRDKLRAIRGELVKRVEGRQTAGQN